MQPAYCSSPAPLTMMGLSRVPAADNRLTSVPEAIDTQEPTQKSVTADSIRSRHTLAGGIQGTHVEDIDALHLSDELQTLETGGLEVVGRDGTGLSTRGNQVLLALDLCSDENRPY